MDFIDAAVAEQQQPDVYCKITYSPASLKAHSSVVVMKSISNKVWNMEHRYNLKKFFDEYRLKLLLDDEFPVQVNAYCEIPRSMYTMPSAFNNSRLCNGEKTMLQFAKFLKDDELLWSVVWSNYVTRFHLWYSNWCMTVRNEHWCDASKKCKYPDECVKLKDAKKIIFLESSDDE